MFHPLRMHIQRFLPDPGKGRGGFSLLELAVVLTIVALVAGSGMVVGHSMIDSAKLAQTNNKLDTIDKALYAYRMANNRLPCPGDGALPPSNANYGVEAANKGSCTGGTPAADFTATIASAASTTVAEGAVPVKALNLPNEFMYDAWGRKIGYAVWTPMTAVGAFTSYSIGNNCGAITIKDASGTTRTAEANYVLISYGADGHGGYTMNGGATRYNAGSTNPDEKTNAHYSSAGANTAYTANYVQKDATQDPTSSTNVFDDFVRYKERWQLQNASDQYSPTGGTPCIPGFVINGYATNQYSSWSVATGDVNGDGIPDLVIGAPGINSAKGGAFVVFGTKSGFPDPLPLNSLNGTNGFELDAPATYGIGNAGYSVSVGDVNGDGIADIVIGAPYSNNGIISGAGAAYVVFGKKSGWAAQTTLDSTFLNGTNGTLFLGGLQSSYIGLTSAVGDVNGDGIPDVILSAPYTSVFTGSVFVIFGKKTGWPSSATTLDHNFIDSVNGVEFDSAYASGIGGILASGDINGDGVSDIITSGVNSPGGKTNAGSTYIIFGKSILMPQTTIVTTAGSTSATVGSIAGLSTCQVINSTHTNVGTTIKTCGGPITCGTTCTSTSVVLSGNASGGDGVTPVNMSVSATTVNSTFLDGTNGVEFDGVSNNDRSGSAFTVGDFNSDGISDLAIGAYTASPHGQPAGGSTYIVFGKKTGWPVTATTLDSTFLDGVNGVELYGVTNYATGYALAAGDLNGDKVSDIVIGTYEASPGGLTYAGSTFIVFGNSQFLPKTTVTNAASSKALTTVSSYAGLMVGQTVNLPNYPSGTTIHDCNGGVITVGTPCTSAINLSQNSTAANNSPGVTMYVSATMLNSTFLNGVNGSEFDGAAANDESGMSVAAVDINGDGISDLIISARWTAPGGNSHAGSTYVYFGKKNGWPATPYGLGGL